MEFPQYRKYANGLNYFKITDKNQLEEIQLIGKKYTVNFVQARILPERNLIMDLLEMNNEYILPITENEYLNFYDDCLRNRKKNLQAEIRELVSAEFTAFDFTSGRNHLLLDVAINYISRFLDSEIQYIQQLVEDEETLAELLKMNLELEGYEVIHSANGTRAVQLAGEHAFSLVVLDIMIPGLDGFEVCQRIRKSGNATPIIFLSAKNSGDDRVHGLKSGGDDYLSKPFNLEELLLRVKLLMGRNARKPVEAGKPEVLTFNEFTVNFTTYEVFKEGKKVQELTKREILLLKLLSEKQYAVVSREEILDKIWGEDAFPSTRTIDNYILAFRKYFNDNPKNPRFFHSIRGVGYKFTP